MLLQAGGPPSLLQVFTVKSYNSLSSDTSCDQTLIVFSAKTTFLFFSLSCSSILMISPETSLEGLVPFILVSEPFYDALPALNTFRHRSEFASVVSSQIPVLVYTNHLYRYRPYCKNIYLFAVFLNGPHWLDSEN